MNISEIVSIHEAGHAVLVYALQFSSTIEVQIFDPPRNGILGLTAYEVDDFKSLIMQDNNSRAYAKDLITIAKGGCVAEGIFTKNSIKCAHGSNDDYRVKKILKAMSISDIDAIEIEQFCIKRAEGILSKNWSALLRVADLFRSNKAVYYYSDISARINPL